MKKLIYILLLLFSLSSCTVWNKIIKKKEDISKTTQTTKSVTDSIVSVFKNRAINDQFSFRVPKFQSKDKHQDSVLENRLNEILKSINYNKRSGKNSYRVKYNPKKRAIETDVTIGETQDKTNSTNKEVEKDSTDFKSVSTFIKKKGIPMWTIIIGIILIFRKQIYWLIKKFFPVVEGFKIVQFFK